MLEQEELAEEEAPAISDWEDTVAGILQLEGNLQSREDKEHHIGDDRAMLMISY